MKPSVQMICCIFCFALSCPGPANAALPPSMPPSKGKVMTPVGKWQGQMKNGQPLQIQFVINSNCVGQVQRETVVNGVVAAYCHWSSPHRDARYGHLRFTLPGQGTHYSFIQLAPENKMRISWKGEMVTLKPVWASGKCFKIVGIQTLPLGAIHFPVALQRPAVGNYPKVRGED